MSGGRAQQARAGDGRPAQMALIVPGDPDQPTGGYRYDARVARELRALGIQVDVTGLAGCFPDADEMARHSLDTALRGLPDGRIAVIDGLALGGLPEIARRHAERLNLIGLVHHPLADETGIAPELARRFLSTEADALAACRRIITTSEFTGRRLAGLGLIPSDAPRDRIRVVPPGVDPARPRRPRHSDFQRLLCVGSLVPRKGQDLLIDALAGLGTSCWRLKLVGDPARNPGFAEALRSRINAHGLAGRIEFCGVQELAALDAAYRNADLLIVPSHYEGYGMVVTEALARGLPMIATTGGALTDTVPPGAAIRITPGDLEALGDALRRWFDNPKLRADKNAGAARARRSLADWAATGRRFAGALEIDTPVPAA